MNERRSEERLVVLYLMNGSQLQSGGVGNTLFERRVLDLSRKLTVEVQRGSALNRAVNRIQRLLLLLKLAFFRRVLLFARKNSAMRYDLVASSLVLNVRTSSIREDSHLLEV